MSLNIIVLAAGRGTRMRSEKPKVLHELGGISLIRHVTNVAQSFSHSKFQVVVGYKAEMIQEAMSDLDVTWVLQEEQLGTGHAVQQCLGNVENGERVLVLYGDVPLIQRDTIESLINSTNENDIGVLTANLECPDGFGRIIRDEYSAVCGIVEHQDATESQKQIKEINTGIMLIPGSFLKTHITGLKSDNMQNELYLTDLISVAVDNGIRVKTAQPSSINEILGVNDRVQLTQLERYYQKQIAEKFILKGVDIADPERIDFRGDVDIGEFSKIDVNVIFEGKVVIGQNVTIASNSIIKNSRIGNNVTINSHSVIEDSTINHKATIGPFARLRPGTLMEEGSKIGNFVETKKAKIGMKSKVNHLSYIGDAEIGESANIGAGTITCNFDGVNKHKTIIDDGAFIGSGTQLVAPIKVGKQATVGAGTTLTKDAPDHALTVARTRQKSNHEWKRPVKKDKMPTT